MTSPGKRRGLDGLERNWEIEFYETGDGRRPVLEWIKHDLTPTKRRALGSAMRRVLQVHGPAVARSSWGRHLGGGIFEFRLRMRGNEIVNVEAQVHKITVHQARRRFDLNPSEDALLRVFCAARGGTIIVLLHAYDKGEDPTAKRQQRAIAEARRRLKELEAGAAKPAPVTSGATSLDPCPYSTRLCA